jgi:arginine/ornithine N-succinyltransferase beta subunit
MRRGPARSGKRWGESSSVSIFPQADALSTISKTFIEQLNPEHPIYLCLLSEAARAIIGSVHPETVPRARFAARRRIPRNGSC